MRFLSTFYFGGNLQLCTTIIRLHEVREQKRESNEEEGKKECNFANEKTHYDAILIKITFIAYQADVHACHYATMFLLDIFMRWQNVLEKLCRIDNRQQLLGYRTSKRKSGGRLHLSCITSGNCNVSVFLSVVELTTSNHFFPLCVEWNNSCLIIEWARNIVNKSANKSFRTVKTLVRHRGRRDEHSTNWFQVI